MVTVSRLLVAIAVAISFGCSLGATTIDLGFFTVDNLLMGAPGVNGFTIANFTGGVFSLPPDFPIETPVTMLNSTITLTGDLNTTIMLGDIAPGSFTPLSGQFATSVAFTSAVFSATLSTTTLTLADSSTCRAASDKLTISLAPSVGVSLRPGDLALITIESQSTAVPEPGTGLLWVVAAAVIAAPAFAAWRRRTSSKIQVRLVACSLLLGCLFVYPLLGASSVTLSPAVTPSIAQPAVTSVTLTGSGFPAGAISPTAVTIHLAPLGAGASADVLSTAVSTVTPSVRRVSFVIPASLAVAVPTTYQISMSGTTDGAVAFSSVNSANITINPPSSLKDVAPILAANGQSLEATIKGQFTSFLQGVTQANFGPGISIGGAAAGGYGPVTVTAPDTALAQLTVGPALGLHDVTVRTASQIAAAPGGFTVSDLGTVNPSSVQQGASATLAITGQFTRFQDGITVANFGPGISVGGGSPGAFGPVKVTSPTTANASIKVDSAALVGTRTVAVETGSEQEQASGAFTVLAGTPVLLSVNPQSSSQGTSVAAIITGQFTSFAQGITQASFGDGISVGGSASGAFGPVTVTGPISATAQLMISATASLGPRIVSVNTGGEQLTLNSGFTVTQAVTAVPKSVKLTLSAALVAPDGSITARAVALDGNGNPINDPALRFQITANPKGQTFGQLPVVSGSTITFPRLVKRLLNQNPVVDPTGEFADTDPTDPNFGKETGGFFDVTATLAGSTLSDTAMVTVLPTGTASITVEAFQYANQLNVVLAEGAAALNTRAPANLAQAQADLRALFANSDFSAAVLGVNRVLAPPNGRPPTVAQLQAAGLTGVTDDGAFATTVAALIAQISSLRSSVKGINAANITTADIVNLQQAANTYKSLVAQLAALRPGAIGITQQETQLDQLLRSELPGLLDSIEDLAIRIFGQIMVAAHRRPLNPRGAYAAVLPRLQSRLRLAARFQFVDVFFTTFSILTDVAGFARDNIIELSLSLANDILNIETANIINRNAPGGCTIDVVVASASVAFVCPNYANTFIAGTGFSPNASAMQVAEIGCVNSQLLTNLLGLSVPNDLAAAIRLIGSISDIVEALERDQSVAALITADSSEIGTGELGGDQIDFLNGWPRVNQGRLPCVGIVIVFNLDTGSFAATNSDFLPSCG